MKHFKKCDRIQNPVFKNCKKLMLPFKRQGITLDKFLSLHLSYFSSYLIHQRPIKYPIKYPLICIKLGSKSKTAFDLSVFTLVFNFGYVCIINWGLSICIHYVSSRFMKLMTQCVIPKKINISVSFIVYLIVNNIINTST